MPVGGLRLEIPSPSTRWKAATELRTGRPGRTNLRRYERFGRGGAKLIWFEATAVCPEGRANTRQLCDQPQTPSAIFASMLELTRRVHREEWGTADDLLEPLQLTHSGRYSVPERIIAYHNPLIDQKTNTPPDYPVISDDRLERLEDEYVEAARLAVEAGFRAIDLKATHGYLLSELLGARLRPGRYGGSLENRTRFIRNVLGKIRAAVGSRADPLCAAGLLRQRSVCARCGDRDGCAARVFASLSYMDSEWMRTIR